LKRKDAELKTDPRILYLDYRQTETGGETVAGDEDLEWPCYEDRTIHFTPVCLFREKEHVSTYLKEDIEVTPEIFRQRRAYLAVARYESGDTFGRSYGHWHVLGLFATMKEAKEAEKCPEKFCKDGYVPWKGYFERFTCTEIHILEIH
jgi:hypothetical protein